MITDELRKYAVDFMSNTQMHRVLTIADRIDKEHEKAIATTLGAGTCHMEQVQHYRVSKIATSWGCVCSACGAFHEFAHGEGWKYCPNCGAKVVDELGIEEEKDGMEA